jgi:ribosomal protein S18 acetylase RimI-like enzyme
MTDPGWDIPGIARETASPAADTGRRDARPANRATAPAPAMSAPGTAPAPAMSAPRAFATAGQAVPPGEPVPADGVHVTDPGQALAYLRAGLEFLAHADPADWPAGVQADCLRALAVAEARQAAAHARLLAAFSVPGGGLAGDGHRSPRMWLTWQTRATRRAATAHVARMKTLQAHPVIAAALAEARVSLSWARQLTDWTGRLPAACRDDADQALLAAAARGAGLAGLHGLAEDLRRRQYAAADADGDDGFADRGVRLATTFGGAGRIEGDLTPRCAAAVGAVLGSLAARRGADDTRTHAQRQHDALEEACTRLLAAGCLPARAGQPVRLELTITLDELARNGQGSPAGPGAACDATIQPVITGHVDHDLLHRLAGHRAAGGRPGHPQDTADTTATTATTATAGSGAAGAAARLRSAVILEQAIALLSGPSGAAAWLRRSAGGPVRDDQPAAGHRRHLRHHPGPPPTRRPRPRPALPLPRLRPARGRLRDPSPHPPQRRRPARPGQPRPALLVPPPHRHPPLGLATHPPPRRHNNRHQPRRRQNPPQPPATWTSRLIQLAMTRGESGNAWVLRLGRVPWVTIGVEILDQATDEAVEAFSRLLPQLSRSAKPLDAAALERMVSSPAITVLIARDDGQIIGSLTLAMFPAPTGLRAWIEDVVVDDAARGRGVGGVLTQEALRLAREAGARTVDLTTRPARAAAGRLYEREGFKQRDTRVYRYVFDEGDRLS